ncbi:uncharacterized protein LOC120358725 [Solenopsis invicta]|uniref:uncharacterized protein LOC120358725 n=1 Tax=Solenopsis invicta TaxID=13686 RepID=UPI00193DC78B|nr:uncharacterized protein LOC120358725 [Solenopsis invicta]
MNLREIIIKVQSVLIPRSSYLRRVCNRAWCTHLRSDSRQTLFKKFKFLINHTTLRNIIKCFNRGLFSGDRDILYIIYNEIVRRGLHNTAYVKNIVSRYDERRNIQEMLANDEDDTFLIECIEQFENCISTTSPNNNELIGENSITDNTANTADITDNTGTINEENKHDINNDRDNSNEFLMEGGGWLWQEFLKLPQPTALETIQSGYVNEKPFDAVQDVSLINNAVCADNNNGMKFQFLLLSI